MQSILPVVHEQLCHDYTACTHINQLRDPSQTPGNHTEQSVSWRQLTYWLVREEGDYCVAFRWRVAPSQTHIEIWRNAAWACMTNKKLQHRCPPWWHLHTCASSSWLSGGCLDRLWGRTTVSRSGFSALRAPLITAAFVPVAPEVYTWFFCRENHLEACVPTFYPDCGRLKQSYLHIPSAPWHS